MIQKISFAIPCYKSVNTIKHVVQEIISTVKENYDYEIVLVDDYSPDNTLSVLLELAATNKKIKVISLARNFGQQGAWMSGFKFCTGDVVCVLDDDGQCPVNDLEKLLNKVREGYDVVFARYPERKQKLSRRIATNVNNFFVKVLIGKPEDVVISSFIVIRKYVIKEVIKYENPYPYLAGLLFKTTSRVTSVPTEHRSRMSGESGYTLMKLISLFLDGLTAFSVKPLRIASLFGIFLTLVSALFCIYLIVAKLQNPDVPMGYSSIMTVILFLAGATMLMMGLIGEYVGRIYISINRSPQYVVRSTYNLDITDSVSVENSNVESVRP